MTKKVIPGHSMQISTICSSSGGFRIGLKEVMAMPKRHYAISVLAFYSLTLVLTLFGTLIGNQAIKTMSEQTPMPRRNRIVIDAGHGGEDGGAISYSGQKESDFNLQIALRLNDLFHLLGYDTIMIREMDTAVYIKGETIAQKKASDLKHRVEIVNRINNSVLLSIHQNSFPESRYAGAQVFYSKTQKSYELAKALQSALVSTLNPGSNRKAKQAKEIYLLDRIKVPGILIECGFISNPQEEAELKTPKYQKKLCCVIASTVAGFLHPLDRKTSD